MSSSETDNSRDDPHLNEVLARYLQAVESGQPIDRWRTLPDEIPRWTVPVLWAVAVSAVIVVAIGGLGLGVDFPRAVRETEFWLPHSVN